MNREELIKALTKYIDYPNRRVRFRFYADELRKAVLIPPSRNNRTYLVSVIDEVKHADPDTERLFSEALNYLNNQP